MFFRILLGIVFGLILSGFSFIPFIFVGINESKNPWLISIITMCIVNAVLLFLLFTYMVDEVGNMFVPLDLVISTVISSFIFALRIIYTSVPKCPYCGYHIHHDYIGYDDVEDYDEEVMVTHEIRNKYNELMGTYETPEIRHGQNVLRVFRCPKCHRTFKRWEKN